MPQQLFTHLTIHLTQTHWCAGRSRVYDSAHCVYIEAHLLDVTVCILDFLFGDVVSTLVVQIGPSRQSRERVRSCSIVLGIAERGLEQLQHRGLFRTIGFQRENVHLDAHGVQFFLPVRARQHLCAPILHLHPLVKMCGTIQLCDFVLRRLCRGLCCRRGAFHFLSRRPHLTQHFRRRLARGVGSERLLRTNGIGQRSCASAHLLADVTRALPRRVHTLQLRFDLGFNLVYLRACACRTKHLLYVPVHVLRDAVRGIGLVRYFQHSARFRRVLSLGAPVLFRPRALLHALLQRLPIGLQLRGVGLELLCAGRRSSERAI